LHDEQTHVPWGIMSTILLVDDDPLQAFARKSILEKHFADVERVKDAAEALCLIEQHGFAEQLCLVILGHHMPGFSGPAFVAELGARLPSLPVLILGCEHETASDYATANAHFAPLPIAADEIMLLIKELNPSANLNPSKATAA
jgi:DNA-binding NtrC family response regulator